MIICVNNNKGGVLKTTTVTNIAGVYASQGKKVLIVDADNQSNVALSFGLNPDNFRTSIYDVLCGGLPPEDAIISLQDNIDLLPSNRDLISFEFDIIGDIKSYPEPFLLMKKALQHLKDDYDYILIDTPPSLGLMNGNVFTFADKVLIPFVPELYAMRSLIEVIDTINDFKEEYNPELEVLGVLGTLVNMQTNLHTGVMQETKRYAEEKGVYVFDTIVPRTIEFANSVSYHKKPATLVTRKSLVGKNKLNYEKANVFYDVCKELTLLLEGNVVK